MRDVLILFSNSKENWNYLNIKKKTFVNYTFKMANINKITYYILYNNFIIVNEEFYIKWYFKKKTLNQNQKDDYMQLHFDRFGK